jgi:hypothetical protein
MAPADSEARGESVPRASCILLVEADFREVRPDQSFAFGPRAVGSICRIAPRW